MNWTGGHLKRHSKTNANPLLKSQKQYFAKARQRLQNSHGPEAPSHFSIFDTKIKSYGPYGDVNVLPPQSVEPRNPQHDFLAISASNDWQTHVVGARGALNDKQISKTSPAGHQRQKRKESPLQPELEPLDRIKQRLLQSSDWAGLAIVKPVSINFTPAEEMEKIGRRRKVTKEEPRRKTGQAGQQQVYHGLIRPFRNPQSQFSAPPAEPTDLSIRIGSNIHQTQTTQPSFQDRQTSPATKSTGTESMLLDRHEEKTQTKIGDASETASPVPLGLQREDDPSLQNLVPLYEAREMNNFDAVIDRSSSVVRQQLLSSTPFGPSRSSHQTSMIAKSPRLEPVASNHQLQLPNQRPMPFEASSKMYTLAQLQEVANNQSHSCNKDDEAMRHQPLKTTKSSLPKRARHDVSSENEEQPPKFTLDYQVALERKLRDHINNPVRGTPPNDLENSEQRSIRPLIPPHAKGDNTFHHTEEGNQSTWRSSPPQVIASTKTPTRLDAPLSMMQKYQIAKEQHQASLQGSQDLVGNTRPQSGRLGDENDAWMRYVFPKDFGRIQQDFNFDMPPPHKPRSKQSTIDSWSYQAPSRSTSETSSMIRVLGLSSTSAPTAANVAINEHQRRRQSQISSGPIESETDFLSRLSPMEGIINETLQNGSIYNNAARTARSFVSMPPFNEDSINTEEYHPQDPPSHGIPAKRTALYAFGSDSQQETFMRDTMPDVPHARRSLHKVPWKQNEGTRDARQATPVCNPITKETSMGSFEQHDPYLIKQRHRKGGFLFSYSPASSQKSKHSQIWNAGPANVDPSPNVSVYAHQAVETPLKPSTRGSQSLWQVSPALSNDKFNGARGGREYDLRSDGASGSLFGSTPSLSHVRQSTPSTSRFF